ncbi:MAG TPA: methyltransferase domain-containing protein, partial [Candidatus Moranbacteria bacterium]|nr:methyltransferase domain-containing protein [Candidatus Moranbacteria bacterium]
DILLKQLPKINLSHKLVILDIGTGSGNIIISLTKKIFSRLTPTTQLYGIDISSKTLSVAKYNAKKNKVAKKIKFIKSDLLKYFFASKKSLLTFKNSSLVIVANLPYLNYKIYSTSMLEVKNFEPKQALYAPQEGLYYYNNLFKEIKKIKKDFSIASIVCLIEISPEQKNKIQSLAKKYFPWAKINFYQDLAKKWRSVLIKI